MTDEEADFRVALRDWPDCQLQGVTCQCPACRLARPAASSWAKGELPFPNLVPIMDVWRQACPCRCQACFHVMDSFCVLADWWGLD